MRRGAYTGRFAPSPTGDLHLGSLYAAVASYLDARAHGGRWLVRIEDLDRAREVPGAADRILETLAAFGFQWDGPVTYQSNRLELYSQAINKLREKSRVFPCICSRRELGDEPRYPGTCRERPWVDGEGCAIRLRIEPGLIEFEDRLHGRFRQDVAAAGGDLLIRRRDGIVAYALGVVVDDAEQGISHVVRGADLLDQTPRQIVLQSALGVPRPAYLHVPLMVEPDGSKLAKSRRSVALEPQAAAAQLLQCFGWLGLEPPGAIRGSGLNTLWCWGVEHWAIARLPRALSIQVG